MKTTKKIYRVWFADFGSCIEFEKAHKALEFMNDWRRLSKGEEATLFINEEDINYVPYNSKFRIK